MIIGLTGYYCSGKDYAAKYLESKGFIHFSLSDEIRKELTNRNIEITRTNLINLGNELRKEHGPNVLAKKVIQNFEPNKNYVISSIRNIHEALELKKLGNFKLINVESPIEIRFGRINERDREEDPKTIEELKEKEKVEQSSDESKQQLHKIKEMSDITILNDSTLEILYERVQSTVNNLES
jgi:dephospho-CoA kinase